MSVRVPGHMVLDNVTVDSHSQWVLLSRRDMEVRVQLLVLGCDLDRQLMSLAKIVTVCG